MSISEIDQEIFKQKVSASEKGFAVFESELLENQYFDQQLKENPQEYPTQEKTESIISKADKFTFCTRLWENTQFEDFQDQGPVLIEFEANSSLPDKYLSEWGNFDVGIFIQAVSREALIRHLRSIFMVNMPNDEEVYYRLQESRKLAGILRSLSEARLNELLGPIICIVWQENCGKDIRYYQAENPNPYQHNQAMGWFCFTQKEKEHIDTAELSWYKRSILSEVIFNIGQKLPYTQHLQNYTQDDLTEILERGYKTASVLGIKSSKGLKFFLTHNLYYPGIMNSQSAINITQENCLESKKIQHLKDLLHSHESYQEVTA